MIRLRIIRKTSDKCCILRCICPRCFLLQICESNAADIIVRCRCKWLRVSGGVTMRYEVETWIGGRCDIEISH